MCSFHQLYRLNCFGVCWMHTLLLTQELLQIPLYIPHQLCDALGGVERLQIAESVSRPPSGAQHPTVLLHVSTPLQINTFRVDWSRPVGEMAPMGGRLSICRELG